MQSSMKRPLRRASRPFSPIRRSRRSWLLATIDELVVTEDARGRGVGKQLVDFAKSVAVRVGARRLELHTARKRPSYERGFYVKNGFTEIDSAVLRWEDASPSRH
jgi:GNAT superfamily N-acetyltransferase